MNMRELRELRKEAKQRLAAETEELINEVTEDKAYYRQLKKWKWWQIFISLMLIILGVGGSFLVGYLTYDQIKTPGWQGSAWFALIYTSIGLFIWLVLGFIKNQRAIRFYNNRRQRYRPTYQTDEAWIQIVRRIILMALVPLMIFAITIAFVL